MSSARHWWFPQAHPSGRRMTVRHNSRGHGFTIDSIGVARDMLGGDGLSTRDAARIAEALNEAYALGIERGRLEAPPPDAPGPSLEWNVHWTDAQGQHRRFVTHAPDIESAAWSAARSIGTLDRVREGRITSVALAAGQQEPLT